MSTVKFKAKIWLRYDDGDYIDHTIVFVDEMDEFTDGCRPGEDWVDDHLRECMDDEQRREMLGIPNDEHSYYAMFSGTLTGWKSSGPEGDDYDEEMELDEGTRIVQLPDDYYGSKNGLALSSDSVLALPLCRPNGPFQKGDTIRDYLVALAAEVWNAGEGFSGKRPFGNSGWESDVYLPLVKAGVITGKIGEDGWLEDCDEEAGDKVIKDAIRRL